MAGALAERVFVDKIVGVGFAEPAILQRSPFSLQDAERYPPFTPDVVKLMKDLLDPAQQDEVAMAVTVTARKPL